MSEPFWRAPGGLEGESVRPNSARYDPSQSVASWVTDVNVLAQRLWYLVVTGTGIFGGALLCLAVCLGAVGVSGLALAIFLHGVTPERQDLVAPIVFDYSQAELRATVELLPPGQLKRENPKISWTGQLMDIWLEASMPETDPNCQIFQVHVELLTAKGLLLEEVNRPALLRCRSHVARLAESVAKLPLLAIGAYSEERLLSLPVVTNYKDTHSLAAARVTVKGRTGSREVPQLYEVSLNVHLRLGWVSQALYLVRSNAILFMMLVLAAVGSLSASLCCSLVGVGTLFLAFTSSTRIEPPSPSFPTAPEAGFQPDVGLPFPRTYSNGEGTQLPQEDHPRDQPGPGHLRRMSSGEAPGISSSTTHHRRAGSEDASGGSLRRSGSESAMASIAPEGLRRRDRSRSGQSLVNSGNSGRF